MNLESIQRHLDAGRVVYLHLATERIVTLDVESGMIETENSITVFDDHYVRIVPSKIDDHETIGILERMNNPPIPPDETVMTAKEIRAFEKSTMPYGIHEGKRIEEIPESYLIWITDNAAFTRRLSRYILAKGL